MTTTTATKKTRKPRTPKANKAVTATCCPKCKKGEMVYGGSASPNNGLCTAGAVVMFFIGCSVGTYSWIFVAPFWMGAWGLIEIGSKTVSVNECNKCGHVVHS